jgi:hypothetical protein
MAAARAGRRRTNRNQTRGNRGKSGKRVPVTFSLSQPLRRVAFTGFERQRDWSGADGFRAIWRRVG